MKKSGEMHDAVIGHIRTTNVPTIVERFGMLRVRFVEYKLQELSASYQATYGGSIVCAMPSNPIFPPTRVPENWGTNEIYDPMYDMLTDDFDWNIAAEAGTNVITRTHFAQ